MSARARAGSAAALTALAVLTTGACAAQPDSVPGSPTPVGDRPTAAPAPAGGAAPTPTGDATTLPLPEPVRVQLLDAWLTGEGVDRAEVKGLRPGATYYGQVLSSGTYWALAHVEPSAAGAQGRSSAKFQGGPWAFSRPTNGAWHLVGATGGRACPDLVPRAMLAAWALSTAGC